MEGRVGGPFLIVGSVLFLFQELGEQPAWWSLPGPGVQEVGFEFLGVGFEEGFKEFPSCDEPHVVFGFLVFGFVVVFFRENVQESRS